MLSNFLFIENKEQKRKNLNQVIKNRETRNCW